MHKKTKPMRHGLSVPRVQAAQIGRDSHALQTQLDISQCMIQQDNANGLLLLIDKQQKILAAVHHQQLHKIALQLIELALAAATAETAYKIQHSGV